MGFEGQRAAHVGLFRESFSEEVALSLALKDVQNFTGRRGERVLLEEGLQAVLRDGRERVCGLLWGEGARAVRRLKSRRQRA